MTGRLRLIATALCALGAGVAGYLTFVHYTGGLPACGISHGCATVQQSEWSKLAGVPVAVIGLTGYVAIGVSLWIRGETAMLAGASMAIAGLVFSGYLTYRELFDIHAVCQWCVTSQTVMLLLAATVVWRLLATPPARTA